MNAPAPKISFVSLGCPKALVDSERILTHLRAEGYELARKHDGADVVIVNTCGFLDSAKAESLQAIGDAMAENGRVIVTGCMGAQPEEIREKYPNLLAVTGPQAYESVVAAVHEAVPPAHDPFLDLVPPQGVKLTPRHYAYLKISEGCNNRCTFCIIPQLRGDLVSRPAADVLREAEKLVKAGVKELLVVSQDTSAYGIDTRYATSPWRDREVRARFYDLAKELGELGAWVRLHYVYPYPHVDEVIPLMAEGKVLPYLDMPLQHASPTVLKRMRRPGNQEKMLERIRSWRTTCPDLAIRSTFIVGFPGRPRRSSRSCWPGSRRPSSSASAASNTSRSAAPPPTRSRKPCRTRSRPSASAGSWRRSRPCRCGCRRPRSASACRSSSTPPAPPSPRAARSMTHRDRRQRPRRLPPPGPGRGHRDGEDRVGGCV